jgi:hypothetical protein
MAGGNHELLTSITVYVEEVGEYEKDTLVLNPP